MKNWNNFLLSAALAMSGLCLADPVYKSTGPDGRVIYSDSPPSTGKGEPKQGIRGKAPVGDGDPVTAAMTVVGREVVIETAYRLCKSEFPQMTAALTDARNRWMQQHEALLSRKIVVLHDRLSDGELRRLAGELERDNEAILDKVRQAPQAERVKWCERAPATFAAPEMNLMLRPTLVKTVMEYRKREPR